MVDHVIRAQDVQHTLQGLMTLYANPHFNFGAALIAKLKADGFSSIPASNTNINHAHIQQFHGAAASLPRALAIARLEAIRTRVTNDAHARMRMLKRINQLLEEKNTGLPVYSSAQFDLAIKALELPAIEDSSVLELYADIMRQLNSPGKSSEVELALNEVCTGQRALEVKDSLRAAFESFGKNAANGHLEEAQVRFDEKNKTPAGRSRPLEALDFSIHEAAKYRDILENKLKVLRDTDLELSAQFNAIVRKVLLETPKNDSEKVDAKLKYTLHKLSQVFLQLGKVEESADIDAKVFSIRSGKEKLEKKILRSDLTTQEGKSKIANLFAKVQDMVKDFTNARVTQALNDFARNPRVDRSDMEPSRRIINKCRKLRQMYDRDDIENRTTHRLTTLGEFSFTREDVFASITPALNNFKKHQSELLDRLKIENGNSAVRPYYDLDRKLADHTKQQTELNAQLELLKEETQERIADLEILLARAEQTNNRDKADLIDLALIKYNNLLAKANEAAAIANYGALEKLRARCEESWIEVKQFKSIPAFTR